MQWYNVFDGALAECISVLDLQGRFRLNLSGTGFKVAENTQWISQGNYAVADIHKSQVKKKQTPKQQSQENTLMIHESARFPALALDLLHTPNPLTLFPKRFLICPPFILLIKPSHPWTHFSSPSKRSLSHPILPFLEPEVHSQGALLSSRRSKTSISVLLFEISQGRLFWHGVKRIELKSAPHGDESAPKISCRKSRAAENPAGRIIVPRSACFFFLVWCHFQDVLFPLVVICSCYTALSDAKPSYCYHPNSFTSIMKHSRVS